MHGSRSATEGEEDGVEGRTENDAIHSKGGHPQVVVERDPGGPLG